MNSAGTLQTRPFAGDQVACFLYGWYLATWGAQVGEPEASTRAKLDTAALLDHLAGAPALY